MSRIFPVLALIVAVAVVGIAILELNERADDEDVAIATTLPSPTFAQPLPATLAPTTTPALTVRGTLGAQTTQAPTASLTQTTEPAQTVAPTATPSPLRTPTPEPAVTVGPIDTSRGTTARTGANPVPAGLAITALALISRAVLGRRRRPY